MTDLTELQSAVDAAQSALDLFYEDQLTRLPNQEAWNTLTQEQQINEWNAEGALKFTLRVAKKALSDEQTRRENFYTARTQAILLFDTQKATERTALIELWQQKEDNNFNTEYTPE